MKRSITSKIIISYLVIIFASLFIVGFIFNFSAKRSMEKVARNDLHQDSIIIENVINSSGQIDTTKVRQKIRDSLKKGVVESYYLVLSKDFSKVLYAKNSAGTETLEFKSQAMEQLKEKLNKSLIKNGYNETNFLIPLNDKEYMVDVMPLRGKNINSANAWIVLYTTVQSIHTLSRSLFRVLLISMTITGVLALFFGIIFARSIAKPIIKLKIRAEMFSKRDFDTLVEIHTGDELEELGNTINKMAAELKEYDIAQKKFLQNASHELKTPLMSIQGYAEGIKDGVFDNNDQALDIITEESTRMKNIVEELIYLSKLETMEDFYKFKNESINDIIEKSIEKVNSIAVKNNIQINRMLYKDANLKADRDKFTQALINIIGNSLRYAKNEINVATLNDGKCFEIRINDDGEGFDQNDIVNVFQRFYKGKKGNTGLGMAITKVIVEKHDGIISAYNGKNGGAEFCIRLPLI